MTEMSENYNLDDEQLETLIATAEPRELPRLEAKEAAFAALSGEWEVLLASRRRRQRSVGFAIAASVVAALSFVLATQTEFLRADPEAFGQIARATGDGYLIKRSDEAVPEQREAGLVIEGDMLSTSTGSRVLIHLKSGGALRIDQDTRAELVSASVLRLREGAVYFDSIGGDDSPEQAPPLRIETPAGTITHLGTQYMARVDRSGTVVAVREGSVSISSPGVSVATEAGQMLRFDRSNRATEQRLSSHAPFWDWVMEIAPSIASQRSSVADILVWIARESGRRVEYVNGAEKLAMSTMVDGLPDVAPLTALDALSYATGFQIDLVDSAIRVRIATDPQSRR